MIIFHRLVQALFLLLFTAVALPGDWHRVDYSAAYQQTFIQTPDLAFAARTPPLASGNVTITGSVLAGNGDLRALNDVGVQRTFLNFDADLIATNNVVPDNWTRVSGAGAQINAPRGYTTYRTPDGDLVHVSPGGLKYGADPKFGNRVDHVLDHTRPNPNKPVHSVFNAQGDDALDLVDEAWGRRGTPDPNDAEAYVIDMGRPIDTAGETSIRIVVRPGTTEIIPAYPQ